MLNKDDNINKIWSINHNIHYEPKEIFDVVCKLAWIKDIWLLDIDVLTCLECYVHLLYGV